MASIKISCPSCEGTLKVSESIPQGKKIKCPKCGEVFPLPGGKASPALMAGAPRVSKKSARPEPADELEDRPALKKSSRPRPDDLGDELEERPAKRRRGRDDADEDEDDFEERRPKKRKKKAKKAAANLPLLIGGGVALVAGIAVLAVIYWPTKTETPVAQADPGKPGLALLEEAQQPFLPRKGAAQLPGKGTPPVASENDPPGKKIYTAVGCARCHALGDTAGGSAGQFKGPRRGQQGPSLAHVGADAEHTVDWLIEQIRNPRAHLENGRMPPYNENRISDQDLRTLAEYLAGLK